MANKRFTDWEKRVCKVPALNRKKGSLRLCPGRHRRVARHLSDTDNSVQILNIGNGVELCPVCNRTIPSWALSYHVEVCKKYYKPEPPKQVKHNRKCIKCGRSCWPNYFYCIRCQNTVEDTQTYGLDGLRRIR